MASCKFNYDSSLENMHSVIQNDNVNNGNIKHLLENTNIVNEIVTHNDIISVVDDKNESIFPDNNIKNIPFYYANRISSLLNIPFKVSSYQRDITIDNINNTVAVPYHQLNKKIISTAGETLFRNIMDSITENFPNIVIIKDERELTYYDIMSIIVYNRGLNLTANDRSYELSDTSGREGYYSNILFLHEGDINNTLAFLDSKLPRFKNISGIAYKINVQHLHKISEKKNDNKNISEIVEIIHNTLLDNITTIDEDILSLLSYLYFGKSLDDIHDYNYSFILNNYLALLIKYPNINSYNYQKIVSSLHYYGKSLSTIHKFLENNNIYIDDIIDDIKENDIELYNNILSTERYNNEVKIEAVNDFHEKTLFYDKNYNYAFIANNIYIDDDNIRLSIDFGDDLNFYKNMRLKFIDEVTGENPSPRLLSLLTGLLVRSGVTVSVVSSEEIEQIVTMINGKYNGEKCFYYKNIIYLNEDIDDTVDLLHELLHPFILLYAKKYPSKIASLVTEIIKDYRYAKMYDKAKKYYNNVKLANEEITVLFLTDYFHNNFKSGVEYEDRDDSIFAYILHQIIDFIKELLGIKEYDILNNSTLRDIVEYIKKEDIVNELSQLSIEDLYANIEYVNSSGASTIEYNDSISKKMNDKDKTSLLVNKSYEFDIAINTLLKKISPDVKGYIHHDKLFMDILNETNNIYNVTKLLLTGTLIDFEPEIKEFIDNHFNKVILEMVNDNFNNMKKIINSINHINEQRLPILNVEKPDVTISLLANNLKLMHNVLLNTDSVVKLINDNVNKYLGQSYNAKRFEEEIYEKINYNNQIILKELLPYLLLVNKYHKSILSLWDKAKLIYGNIDVNSAGKKQLDEILKEMLYLTNSINENVNEAIISTVSIINYNSLMYAIKDIKNLSKYETITEFDNINLDDDETKKLIRIIKDILDDSKDFLSNTKLLFSHKNDDFIININKNKKLLKQLLVIINKIKDKKAISEKESKILNKGISYFVKNFKNVTARDIYNIILYQFSDGNVFEKYLQPALNVTNNNVYALSLVMRIFELNSIRKTLDTTYEVNELDKTLDSLDNKREGTKSVLNDMLTTIKKKISIDDTSEDKNEIEVYAFQYIHKVYEYGYLISRRRNILNKIIDIFNDIDKYSNAKGVDNISELIIDEMNYRIHEKSIDDYLNILRKNGVQEKFINELKDLFLELGNIDNELSHYYSFKNSLALEIEQKIDAEIENIKDNVVREGIRTKMYKLKILNERILLLASLLDGILKDFKEFENKDTSSFDIIINELDELYSERQKLYRDIFDPNKTDPQELKILKLFREYYERKTQFYTTIAYNIPKFIDAVIKNFLTIDKDNDNVLIKMSKYIRTLSNYMRVSYKRDKYGKILYYENINNAYERLYEFYKSHGISQEDIDKVKALANYLLHTLQEIHDTDVYSEDLLGLDKLYKHQKDIKMVNDAIVALMEKMRKINYEIRNKLEGIGDNETFEELTEISKELYNNSNKAIRPKIYSDILFELNKYFEKNNNDKHTNFLLNRLASECSNVLGKKIITGLILSNYALKYLEDDNYDVIDFTLGDRYEFRKFVDEETGEVLLEMRFNDGTYDNVFRYSIDKEFFKKFDILFIEGDSRQPLLSPFVTYRVHDDSNVHVLDINDDVWGSSAMNKPLNIINTYLQGMTVNAQFTDVQINSKYKTPSIVGLTITTNGEFLPISFNDNIFIYFANYIIKKYNITVEVNTLEDAFSVLNDNNDRIQISDFFEFLLDDITNNGGKIFIANINNDKESKYLNKEFIDLYSDIENNASIIKDTYKMIIWYLKVQYRFGITNFNVYLEYPRYNIDKSEILYVRKDFNIKKVLGWMLTQLGYNITEINYEELPKDPTKTVEMLANIHIPFFGLNILGKDYTSKDISSLYFFIENGIKYLVSRDMFPIAYSISYIYGMEDLLNDYVMDKKRTYGRIVVKDTKNDSIDVTEAINKKKNKNFLIRALMKNFNLKHLNGAQVTFFNKKTNNNLAIFFNAIIKVLAGAVFIPFNLHKINNILANFTSQQIILLSNIISNIVVTPSEAWVKLLETFKTPKRIAGKFLFQMHRKENLDKTLDKILQLGFIHDEILEIRKLRRIYSIRKPLNLNTIGFFLKSFIEYYTLIDGLSSAMHDKRIKIGDRMFSLDEITEFNKQGYLVTKEYVIINNKKYFIPKDYSLIRNKDGKITYIGNNIIELLNAIKQDVQLQTGGLFNKNTIGFFNEMFVKFFLFLKSFYIPYLQKLLSPTAYNINTKRYQIGFNTINAKKLTYNFLLLIKSYLDVFAIRHVENIAYKVMGKKNVNKNSESYKVSEDIVRWTLPYPILMLLDVVLVNVMLMIVHGFTSLFGSDDDDDKEKMSKIKEEFEKFNNANKELKDFISSIKTKEQWIEASEKNQLKVLQDSVNENLLNLNMLFYSCILERIENDKLKDNLSLITDNINKIRIEKNVPKKNYNPYRYDIPKNLFFNIKTRSNDFPYNEKNFNAKNIASEYMDKYVKKLDKHKISYSLSKVSDTVYVYYDIEFKDYKDIIVSTMESGTKQNIEQFKNAYKIFGDNKIGFTDSLGNYISMEDMVDKKTKEKIDKYKLYLDINSFLETVKTQNDAYYNIVNIFEGMAKIPMFKMIDDNINKIYNEKKKEESKNLIGQQ